MLITCVTCDSDDHISSNLSGRLLMNGAQEHNTLPWPGLKPRQLTSESSVLTIRPPHSPVKVSTGQ